MVDMVATRRLGLEHLVLATVVEALAERLVAGSQMQMRLHLAASAENDMKERVLTLQ